jgi:IclR family transcriptional regulator, KDG regulon repressor
LSSAPSRENAEGTHARAPRAAAPHGRKSRDGTQSGGVRAAERVLRILTLMTTDERIEWTLDDISVGTELPKSTTHRLLDTLARQHFVEPGVRAGSYRLGLRAAVVGNMAIRARRPQQDVHEILRAAVAEIGESIGLSLREDATAVIVDKVASPQPLHWNLGVGASLPVHCSASGKVLLSGLTDEAIIALYDGQNELPPGTPNAVATVDELIGKCHEVRQLGYAIDDEELERGLRCIAVPVYGTSGRLVYGLAVSGPASRLSTVDLVAMVERLRRAADEMAPHVELVPD